MADQEFPDVYSDNFNITVTPYGVNLTFAKSPPIGGPNQGQPETQVVVRMSHQHAKVVLMLAKRQLKRFEEDLNVSVDVPFKVMNDLGLSNEDW